MPVHPYCLFLQAEKGCGSVAISLVIPPRLRRSGRDQASLSRRDRAYVIRAVRFSTGNSSRGPTNLWHIFTNGLRPPARACEKHENSVWLSLSFLNPNTTITAVWRQGSSKWNQCHPSQPTPPMHLHLGWKGILRRTTRRGKK